MPGMWDCHVHFAGYTSKIETDIMDYSVRVEPELAVGRSIKHCKQALEAGFTSVREVGGVGYYLKQLINEGTIVGPNIYHCGKALSITSGACDEPRYSYNYMHNNCSNGGDSCCPSILGEMCNGEEECILAVRKQVRKDCSCIKIYTTGAVLSSIGNTDERQFNDKEIRAIVNEAKQTGRIVAAHAHGRAGILAAINNGVKTIEHGTCIDDEICHLMNEKGCIFVPTRWVFEYLIGPLVNSNNNNNNNGSKNFNDTVNTTAGASAEKDEKTEAKMEETQKVATDVSILKGKKAYMTHENAIKCAIKHNVTIACGTDMFVDEWSKMGQELMYYVKYGMSNLEAIECATANGPLTLGETIGPKSGQLKVGYDADMIALSKNPLDNIQVLSHANNVVIVWKNGKIAKNIWNSQNAKL